MKMTPAELTANGYVLLDQMDHTELIAFVKKYLRKRTVYSLLYYLSNIVFAGLLVFIGLKYHRQGHLSIINGMAHFSIGIAVAFAMIPLHEFIHALAYKSQGAKQTSYDVNAAKFYFLAIADQFLASRREFNIVALSPFIIVSLLLIAAFFISGPSWSITMLSALMTHASFCSGDFALLSYFAFNKDKEVVTYDDKANKISFFYGR